VPPNQELHWTITSVAPLPRCLPLNSGTLDSRVIVEHEVIEQVEEEASGRTLDWVCALIRNLGRDDPFVVLGGMWRAGYVMLADDAGQPLPDWRSAELFREKTESSSVNVLATALGSERVHG